MNHEIRPARPEDVADLAKLQVIAADGVIDAIYHDLIPGKPINEIIERRYHRLNTTGSYENCWVTELGREVVGALHAFPLDDMAKELPDPLVPEERFAVVETFDHLDPVAAGSFHINVVALYPAFRGRGIGTLSLAVFEENAGALRLYRPLGFEEADRGR